MKATYKNWRKHLTPFPVGYWRICGRAYGLAVYVCQHLNDEDGLRVIDNPATEGETLYEMYQAYPNISAWSEHLWFMSESLWSDEAMRMPLKLREQEMAIGVLEALTIMDNQVRPTWYLLGEMNPVEIQELADLNDLQRAVSRYMEQFDADMADLYLPFNNQHHQWVDTQHAVSYLIGTGRAHDAYGIDTGDDRLAQYIVPLVRYNPKFREMLRKDGTTAVVSTLLEKFPSLRDDMEYRKPLEEALDNLLKQVLGNYSIYCKSIGDWFIIYDNTYFGIRSILEWAEQPHEEGQPYIYVEKFPRSNDMDEDILNIFFSKTPFPNNFAELININTPIKEHTNSRISESIPSDYLPMIHVENDYALLAK